MGESEPYVVFVRQHADALFRTAFMLTGNQVDAEELLQDTLALLYPRWTQVVGARSPLAYVRRSLANRLVSVRRRPSSREASLSALGGRSALPDLADAVADRDQMWQMLATLSARQRAALVLRYLYDMPDEEIADALGCRPATIRSLTSRAAASLRTQTGETTVAVPGNGAVDHG